MTGRTKAPPTPPPLPDRVVLERQILQLVSQLVDELRPGAAAGIGLSNSLERELGLGSLERVELLARIERAIGVRIADTAGANADTPAALVDAILTTDPTITETLPAVRAALAVAPQAPDSADTLVDVLRWHAERSPDRPHIFLRVDEENEHTITYGELWKQALSVANGLTATGIGPRDAVAIMLRTEAAFFPAFFGALLLGAIPVPIYPPFRADRIVDYARRQEGILSNAGARLLITFADVERLGVVLRSRVTSLTGVVTLGEIISKGDNNNPESTPPAVWLTGQDPALIQYTSGSTGQPKGVLLTHANLLANIRAISAGLDIQPDDVAVSWLPLYHDMGLIGAWLSTLYVGVPVAILSPLSFLSRPARWLWAIHAHRGTLSVAPNFAFDLCVNKITDEEIDGLDLSSLRIVLNGSEAVLPQTMSRFIERFAPCGFRPDAMRPVYGLAECSVGLTVTPQRHPARVDRVTRAFQTTGHAEPTTASDALRFVSCGSALPDHEIRIVSEHGAAVEERHEGRIQFRGPSMMAGYYRNPAATGTIRTDDGWLDSGDLGYLVDNELFLTGRRKDVIIKGGRNIYPHEAEAVVATIEGVRKGCIAAFGVADASLGTERLVIVAETRISDPGRLQELEQTILERVTEVLSVPPDTVVLAGPGAVLKTSSGKVRRGATRDHYQTGRLERGPGSMTRQWITLGWQTVAGRCRQTADVLVRAAYTSYVVGLVMLFVPPLWALVSVSRQPLSARAWLTRFSRFMMALSGCRVTVTGQDRLANLGPAVFVANHASYLDVVLILATLPGHPRFAAKGRLATYPVLGTMIPRAGYLRIEKTHLADQMDGADEVEQTLSAGESMFVFPEGTFVRAPGLLPFRLGAFRAAAETQRPVVPVTLAGTRRVFPAHTFLLQPGPLRVEIGAPLTPQSTEWGEIIRLRDESRRIIRHGTGEAAG